MHTVPNAKDAPLWADAPEVPSYADTLANGMDHLLTIHAAEVASLRRALRYTQAANANLEARLRRLQTQYGITTEAL